MIIKGDDAEEEVGEKLKKATRNVVTKAKQTLGEEEHGKRREMSDEEELREKVGDEAYHEIKDVVEKVVGDRLLQGIKDEADAMMARENALQRTMKERMVLGEVGEILIERNQQHGDIKENFDSIAKMWSVVLKQDVKPEQVVLCMICLKIARISSGGAEKVASWLDIGGYTPIGTVMAKEGGDENKGE